MSPSKAVLLGITKSPDALFSTNSIYVTESNKPSSEIVKAIVCPLSTALLVPMKSAT